MNTKSHSRGWDIRLKFLHSIVADDRKVSVHPLRSFVAIAFGTKVCFWDWVSDTTAFLTGHEGEIECLKFTPDGLYLISADSGRMPGIIAWNVADQKEMYRTQRTESSPHVISMAISYDGKFLATADSGNQAALTVWDWSRGFSEVYLCPIDNISPITHLEFIPLSYSIVTLERGKAGRSDLAGEVQIWQIAETGLKHVASRSSALALSSALVALSVSDDSGLIYLLCTDRILSLDSVGRVVGVTSMENEPESKEFTCVAHAGTNLLVGCADGWVYMYDSNTMRCLLDIPPQPHIRDKLVVSMTTPVNGRSQVFTGGVPLQPQNFRVCAVGLSLDARYVVVGSANGSMLVVDLENSEVSNFLLSHTAYVTSLVTGDAMGNSLAISASSDETLLLWRVVSNRFLPSIVELRPLLHPSLSRASGEDSRGLTAVSDYHLFANVVMVHPTEDVTAIGFSHGIVMILSQSCSRLDTMVTTEFKSILAGAFSPCGRYLVLGAASGAVLVLDKGQQYRKVALLQPGVVHSQMGPPVLRKVLVAPVTLSGAEEAVKEGKKSALLLGSNASSGLEGGRPFLVCTLKKSSSVTVYRVMPQQDSVMVSTACDFVADSPIVGLAVHASQEYLFVLSLSGLVYLFHLPSAQSRGAIRVPRPSPLPNTVSAAHPTRLALDVSGLYVAVVVPTFLGGPSPSLIPFIHPARLLGQAIGAADDGTPYIGAKAESSFPTEHVYIFEAGTGRYCTRIPNLKGITALTFTAEGDCLLVGTVDGSVLLYQILAGMKQNIDEVLSSSRGNLRSFWRSYPIYLQSVKQMTQHSLTGQELKTQLQNSRQETSRGAWASVHTHTLRPSAASGPNARTGIPSSYTMPPSAAQAGPPPSAFDAPGPLEAPLDADEVGVLSGSAPLVEYGERQMPPPPSVPVVSQHVHMEDITEDLPEQEIPPPPVKYVSSQKYVPMPSPGRQIERPPVAQPSRTEEVAVVVPEGVRRSGGVEGVPDHAPEEEEEEDIMPPRWEKQEPPPAEVVVAQPMTETRFRTKLPLASVTADQTNMMHPTVDLVLPEGYIDAVVPLESDRRGGLAVDQVIGDDDEVAEDLERTREFERRVFGPSAKEIKTEVQATLEDLIQRVEAGETSTRATKGKVDDGEEADVEDNVGEEEQDADSVGDDEKENGEDDNEAGEDEEGSEGSVQSDQGS